VCEKVKRSERAGGVAVTSGPTQVSVRANRLEIDVMKSPVYSGLTITEIDRKRD